ncbi:MAG: protein kinase [Planctomycetota bacterium]
MSSVKVNHDDDATRLSDDQILDRFRGDVAATPTMSVGDFFARNPAFDPARHLVPTIIADIARRTKIGQPISPRVYFDQHPELASCEDAWRILDAAEPWLVANEGSNWADAWVNDYPEMAERFVQTTSDAKSLSEASSDLDLDALQPGDRLLDFEVLRFIGEGTFGRVYLANDLTLDRQCALKVTTDQGSEGQVLARLNHPGIVHVYREQTTRGKKFLAMQFVDGLSLADWIRKATTRDSHKAFDVTEAVRMIRDVATSLKHAHSRGVLHRDIKPANILIDELGNPMLSDFNVATSSDRAGRFTAGGTVNYMSPEQLQAVCLNDSAADQRVDIRSDVYSLGVVLLESLTGQKVWSVTESSNQDAAANQLLASRIRSAPPSIANLPGVTPSLAAVVDKALQPNTDDRYQTAAELETDLTNWLSDRNNTFATNPSFIERTRRRVQRHRNWWAGLTVAASLLVASLAYGYVADQRQLDRCDEMAQQTEQHLFDRQLTSASESLGQARAQLRQVGLAAWLNSDRYNRVSRTVASASRRISSLEAERFTSLFGEISLRRVHQNQPSDLGDLIEDSLRAYNVMTASDWQQRSPFADLSPTQQDQVAEGITELMLVSMYQSASQNTPTCQQVQQVLDRLPEQHQSLSLFQTIADTQAIRPQPFDPETAAAPYESYLHGVVATMNQDDATAAQWYAHSLRNLAANQPQRFWWHYRYAFTLQKLGKHQEAFIHYGVCLGLQPNFAWPKFNMGLACLDIGNPELAETYVRQAIQADPNFTAAYVALIAIQTKQERYSDALKTYDLATAKGLSSPELTRNHNIAKSKHD